MVPNFNRIIELSRSEFLVMLPDDDLLYPDYLRETIRVAERYPTVGIVHSAFDFIDAASDVLEHARKVISTEQSVVIESPRDFLERAMSSPWTICWPSALFRRDALVRADGLRVNEQPMEDFALFMRIAYDWEIAFISATLAAMRFHPNTATAALGQYTGRGYDLRDDQPRILHRHRRRFLDEVVLRADESRHYRSLADRTFRQEEVHVLRIRAGTGMPWLATWGTLARRTRSDPRTLLVPGTWRLCAAQLGARRIKRVFRPRSKNRN